MSPDWLNGFRGAHKNKILVAAPAKQNKHQPQKLSPSTKTGFTIDQRSGKGPQNKWHKVRRSGSHFLRPISISITIPNPIYLAPFDDVIYGKSQETRLFLMRYQQNINKYVVFSLGVNRSGLNL